MNVFLSFPRSESTQELQLVVPMLMVHEQVDIDADVVDSLDVDRFESLNKLGLVDVLLKRMQVDL